MNAVELLAWQWQGYVRNHASRANLLMHIVLVPLFVAGNIAFVLGLVRGAWLVAVAGLVATGVSIALQGRGHALEVEAPVPFTGPRNALARIFLEQWVTFPRFVLSGGWWRALRAASSR